MFSQVLEETYRLELAMHEKTFVGQPDTLAQIHKNFYPEMETSSAIVPPVEEVLDSDVLPAVTASLKTLLANELQMRESDVEENVQFVDLGLDSISGVSWVRKINEKYDTSIEAAKLYSHATLSQLSRYVKQEAERHGTLSRPSVASCARDADSFSEEGDQARGEETHFPAQWHSIAIRLRRTRARLIHRCDCGDWYGGPIPAGQEPGGVLAEPCPRQELHHPGAGQPLGY